MIRKRMASLDDKSIYRLIIEQIAPFSSTYQSSPTITFASIHKRLNRNVTIVAANGTGSLFGFVTFICKKKTLFVDMLAVDAHVQGKGWGQKLMKSAENFGRIHGCDTIQLFVDESNSGAIGFYERLGYMKSEYLGSIHCFRLDKIL